MSAYLCSEYHIGRMAAFLVAARGRRLAHDVAFDTTTDAAGQIAAILARENIASVDHCYSDSGGARSLLADGVTETSYVLRCKLAARARWGDEHTPDQMMKAARCYEYQSCEHQEWRGSLARVLSNLVYRVAGDKLLEAAYPHFSWELDPPPTPASSAPERRPLRLQQRQSG